MEPKKMRFWDQKYIRALIPVMKILLEKDCIFICRKPDGVDHTPLADAIMIGNVEMVKAIMPYTKVTANPKGRGFVSYLHVAAKYGQLEILKILLEHFEKKKFDWLKLKDKEGRSVWDLLKVSKFQKQLFCSHLIQKTNEIVFLFLP